MTWKDLIGSCASQVSMPRPKLNAVIQAFFANVAQQALHGDKVVVPGFGTFYPSKRKARVIRNPATKELMEIPEMRAIGFRTSRLIKR